MIVENSGDAERSAAMPVPAKPIKAKRFKLLINVFFMKECLHYQMTRFHCRKIDFQSIKQTLHDLKKVCGKAAGSKGGHCDQALRDTIRSTSAKRWLRGKSLSPRSCGTWYYTPSLDPLSRMFEKIEFSTVITFNFNFYSLKLIDSGKLVFFCCFYNCRKFL